MARFRQAEQKQIGLRHRARHSGFARAEDGSLIIFALFLLIIMLAAGGMGVDFMRFEAQRVRLQSTLDRAVLAAASMDQPLPPRDVVVDYFTRAGLQDYINTNDISVVDTLTSRQVTAKASVTMDTTLLRFAGIDTLLAPASGAAEESASQTEISLVLDVSGSMGQYSDGTTKINILKSAAKNFVNIVLCNPADPSSSTCTVEQGKVSVNIVPYSEQVLWDNNQLNLLNVTQEHSYSACVTFGDTDYTTTALDPNVALKRTGHFDAYTYDARYSASNWTCRTDSWRRVTPVGSSPSSLRSRIDALQASGNTSIDVGMKWGSMLLDPSMQDFVHSLVLNNVVDVAYDGRPYGWSERGVEKVIVLMTDGVNTNQPYLYDFARDGDSPVWKSNYDSRYSIYNPSTNQYWWEYDKKWMDHAYGTGTYTQCTWTYSWWTGYTQTCTEVAEGNGQGATHMTYPALWAAKPWVWYNQWSWLPSPGSVYQNAIKNSRLQTICDAAKAEDITVFTVGFEVTSDSATVLRNCASSPAHYFNVQGLDLTDAFAAIARQISKLRLIN